MTNNTQRLFFFNQHPSELDKTAQSTHITKLHALINNLQRGYNIDYRDMSSFVGELYKHTGEHSASLASTMMKLLNASLNGKIANYPVQYLRENIADSDSVISAIACYSAIELHSRTSEIASACAITYIQVYRALYFPTIEILSNANWMQIAKSILSNTTLLDLHIGRKYVSYATHPMNDVLLQATVDLVKKFKPGGKYFEAIENNKTAYSAPMRDFIQYLQNECLGEEHVQTTSYKAETKASEHRTPVQETPFATIMKKQICEFILNTIYPENKSLIDRIAVCPNDIAVSIYIETADLLRRSTSVRSLLGGASAQEMRDMVAANYPRDMVKGLPDALIHVYIMKAANENPGIISELFDAMMRIAVDDTTTASDFSHQRINALHSVYSDITNPNFPPTPANYVIAGGVKKLASVIQDIKIHTGISPENEKLFNAITQPKTVPEKTQTLSSSDLVIALAGEILTKNELAIDIHKTFVAISVREALLISNDLCLIGADEKKVISALVSRPEFPYLGSFIDEMIKAGIPGAQEFDLRALLYAAPIGAITKSIVTDIALLRTLVSKMCGIEKKEVNTK